MKNYFYEHHFNVKLAEKYGVFEAIILYNLVHWVEHNKNNNNSFYDGRYWTFNSVQAFTTQFTYLSKDQITRTLKRLKDKGAIVTGEYNKTKYDRTKWYSVTDEVYETMESQFTIGQNKQMDLAISPNEESDIAKPIPYNKQYNKQYNAAQPQQGNDTYHDTLYDTAIADYQNNIHPLSSSIEKEQLIALIEEAGAGNVIEAIKRAVKNNARRLAYIETVAKGLADGIDFEAKKKQKPQNNIPEDIRKRLEDIAYARVSESSYTDLEWKILGKVDYQSFRYRKMGTEEQWFNKLCEAYLEVK